LTDRARFITHQGKQILLVDLSNCSTVEVEHIVRALPELVTTRPRGSTLILSDFTGASFDPEAIRAMKETAFFDKAYIKKSAWVGAENFPKVLSENIKELLPTRVSYFQNPRGSSDLAGEGLNKLGFA
jgi:hypothetical protein